MQSDFGRTLSEQINRNKKAETLVISQLKQQPKPRWASVQILDEDPYSDEEEKKEEEQDPTNSSIQSSDMFLSKYCGDNDVNASQLVSLS